MGWEDRLKKLDGNSPVAKEFRVYTLHGAVLSVVTVTIILYLVFSEASYNFQVVLHERVYVNATNSRGLEMEFDITLPEVPCSKLRIDANDHQGQAQSLHLDQKHHLWKHRVKMKGNRRVLIGSRSKLEMGSTLLSEETLVAVANETGMIVSKEDAAITTEEEEEEEDDPSNACGSCYGAGEEGECCNTCEDVRRVYKQRGWVLDTEKANIVQCKEQEEKDEADEGCNVHGVVALSTGGGDLHLAPGEDVAKKGFTILDMLMQSFQQWNVTHQVHKIRFGPDHPSASYQLDGREQVIQDTYGMYQYYFQIVPTVYKFMNGTTVSTNQYSVMEHLRHVNPGSNRGLPGVFFFYEVSPLHVEIREGYRKGWVAFFTSVCAIIGGVVTTMGLLDQFLFQTSKKGQGEQLMR